MHGERCPRRSQAGERNTRAQRGFAAPGAGRAGEVLVPDIGRVADDCVVRSGGGQKEEVADLDLHLVSCCPDEPLSLTGAALVELDAIEVPAGSTGRPGERVEALAGGEQERRFAARRLKDVVTGSPYCPVGDVPAQRGRCEEGPACLTRRRPVHARDGTRHPTQFRLERPPLLADSPLTLETPVRVWGVGKNRDAFRGRSTRRTGGHQRSGGRSSRSCRTRGADRAAGRQPGAGTSRPQPTSRGPGARG